MFLLVSFLYLVLKVAIVILVAYAVVWLCRIAGIAIDGNVYKWGSIVVGIICIILIVVWLLGAIAGSPAIRGGLF